MTSESERRGASSVVRTFFPVEAKLFLRLLTIKGFEVGTETNIAAQLEGRTPGRQSREFVKKMISLGCLRYEGTGIGDNNREYAVYSRDKKRMREIFEATPYYRMAEAFYMLIELPGFEIG